MQEPGKCPKCGEKNLDYESLGTDDDLIYYPFICLECGERGREWYSLSFLDFRTAGGEEYEKTI